jgi:transposase
LVYKCGLNLLGLALYSPDLNLIEHAWAKLKEMVDKEFPEISRGLGKGEYNLK